MDCPLMRVGLKAPKDPPRSLAFVGMLKQAGTYTSEKQNR